MLISPAWNGGVFGEESTPSLSSLWESASKDELSVGMEVGTDIDMQLQFPGVKGRCDRGTEAGFLRAIIAAVQSSPKMASLFSHPSVAQFTPFAPILFVVLVGI